MNQFFIEFGTNKARVCEWGDKSNPEIICFHGLGSTAFSFLEVVEKLKDRYHILSFDLPGHGQSRGFDNDEDYQPPNLINWVEEVISRVGKESFNILAHSWGASVALHYAAEYPEKVEKMLLLDGGYHDMDKSNDYFRDLYEAGKLNYKPNCTLEEDIEYYMNDFDGFIFDDKISFFEAEKANQSRCSDYIEASIYDLMKEEDGKIRWHCAGKTARAALKFQYNVQETLRFDNIKSEIIMLYADLPEAYFKIRTQAVNEFAEKVKMTVKLYKDTTHMMHWDRPNEIVEEAVSFFGENN